MFKTNNSIADLVASSMAEQMDSDEFRRIHSKPQIKTAAKKKDDKDEEDKSKGKAKSKGKGKDKEVADKEKDKDKKSKKKKATTVGRRVKIAVSALDKLSAALDEIGFEKSATITLRALEQLVLEAQEYVADTHMADDKEDKDDKKKDDDKDDKDDDKEDKDDKDDKDDKKDDDKKEKDDDDDKNDAGEKNYSDLTSPDERREALERKREKDKSPSEHFDKAKNVREFTPGSKDDPKNRNDADDSCADDNCAGEKDHGLDMKTRQDALNRRYRGEHDPSKSTPKAKNVREFTPGGKDDPKNKNKDKSDAADGSSIEIKVRDVPGYGDTNYVDDPDVDFPDYKPSEDEELTKDEIDGGIDLKLDIDSDDLEEILSELGIAYDGDDGDDEPDFDKDDEEPKSLHFDANDGGHPKA